MRLFLLILLLSFSHYSFATIYKCKSNNGKVTYANSPCSSSPSIVDLDQYESVIDSSLIRDKIQRGKNQTIKLQNDVSEPSDENLMSSYDIDIRLRELSIDMQDSFSYPEKREDSSTEYQFLKSKHAQQLSYELEKLRKNLKVDLSSNEIAKRTQAVSKLRSIYLNY